MFDCEHRNGDSCKVAAKLANLPRVPVIDAQCEACSKEPIAYGPNQVTASIAISAAKATSEEAYARTRDDLMHLLILEVVDPGYGPGTELHRKLKRRGYEPSKGCPCPARIAQMNKWGPDGCRANRNTIFRWLREEAENINIRWTFAHGIVARRWIEWAIRRSERTLQRSLA